MNRQKKYDIDFARLEKISAEAYAYYFQLFIDQILPRLKSIPPAVTIDADQIEQDELKKKLDLIAAQAQTSFNLNRLAASASAIFSNIKAKSEKGFVDEMKKRMSVAFQKKKLATAIREEVIGRMTQSVMGLAKSMDDISTRSARLYGEDQWTKQQQQIQAVTNRVLGGVSAGERWESIAKSLMGSADLKSGDAVIKNAAKDGDSTAKKMVNQAKFIARNAASSVVGAYDKELATSSGGSYYMWQTSEDERVRPTHAALNGKVFSWNPGQKAVADITYADSNFSKGQTIPQAKDQGYNGGAPTYPGQPYNCFPGSVNIPLINRAKKVFRTNFRGELVTLITDKGKLEVTPNHPILTPHGFIRADLLNVGDNLVSCFSKNFDGREQYIDGLYTKFSEFFDTLNFMFGSQSYVSGSGMDFYGDSIEGEEIKIVSMDGFLPNKGDIKFAQYFCEEILAKPDMTSILFAGNSTFKSLFDSSFCSPFSNVRFVYDLSSLFRSSIRKADNVCLRAIADFYAHAFKLYCKTFPSEVNSIRYRENRFISQVSIDNIHRDFAEVMRFSFGSIIKPGNIPVSEFPHNIVLTDANFTSNIGNRDSLDVFRFDKIEKIIRNDFSGHVFTLETISGSYVAEKNLVGNCRCVAINLIAGIDY